MKFRRRQLILASLVLALGTAVYLNWQFTDNKGLFTTEILDGTRELGEATFVNSSFAKNKEKSEETAPVSNITNESSDEQANENGSSGIINSSDYFAGASVAKQKARDTSVEVLKNAIKDMQASDQTKTEAFNKLAELSKVIQQESNIENLIKSKGVANCLVFIQNRECRVVVSPGSLNDNLVVTIFEMVSGQSGIANDKIKISEAK